MIDPVDQLTGLVVGLQADLARLRRLSGALDGVDVEELRRVMADPERLIREPTLSDWCVLVDTAQIVLAALAEGDTTK